MPGIGDTLREARMRQRIDITDVESATKIRAKYLRALENEEFELLHGSTFVRSFLRTYAQYLGLDAQRLIEQYRAEHERRDLSDLHPHIAPKPQRTRDRDRRRGGGPPRGALVVVLVLAVLGLLLVLGLTGGDEQEPAGGRAETAQTSAERERGSRRERRRRSSRRPAARSVSVRIAPAEPTYVCVDRGPGTDVVFEGTIDAPRTFRGRRVRINLGRTSAAVRVNGRALDTGAGSDPVGFDITPRARRPLATGQRPCA